MKTKKLFRKTTRSSRENEEKIGVTKCENTEEIDIEEVCVYWRRNFVT